MIGWQEYVLPGAIALATIVGAWWISRRVTRPFHPGDYDDPESKALAKAIESAANTLEQAGGSPAPQPKVKLRKRIRAKLAKLKPSPAQWVGILMVAGWSLLTWGLAGIFTPWAWPLVMGIGLLVSAGVLLFTLASEAARRDDQNP